MICQILLFLMNLLTSAPTGPPAPPVHHEKPQLCISQTASPGTPQPPAFPCENSSRLINRTLQALRKTKLLVCNRKRSRSEVLPVGQSPWVFQTANGLRSTRIQGTGGSTLGQLQIGARNFGRHLRNQSRVTIPARGAVAAECRRLFPRQRSP